MPSDYETFWQFDRYAVVGHGAKRPFPRLTYAALKKINKSVAAVDPSSAQVDGDRTYADLASVPGEIEAVVIEVPKAETAEWIERAAERGIQHVWLHMNTDTPEALACAERHQMHVRKGTCAVMYLERGFSPHAIHGFVMKLLKKY